MICAEVPKKRSRPQIHNLQDLHLKWEVSILRNCCIHSEKLLLEVVYSVLAQSYNLKWVAGIILPDNWQCVKRGFQQMTGIRYDQISFTICTVTNMACVFYLPLSLCTGNTKDVRRKHKKHSYLWFCYNLHLLQPLTFNKSNTLDIWDVQNENLMSTKIYIGISFWSEKCYYNEKTSMCTCMYIHIKLKVHSDLKLVLSFCC